MPYEVKQENDLTRLATVTVEAEEYQKTVNKELRKIGGRAKIRGFRKGKVPLNVLKQQYGPTVQRDVIDNLVNKYIETIVKEESDVLYVDQPNVTNFDENKGFTFDFAYEIKPPVDPIGYLGLEVEKPPIEVSSEEIDDELEKLRDSMATLMPIEHRDTVSKGDVVTFDFEAVGTEPPELAELQGKDAQIVAGEAQTLGELDAALIGAKFPSTFNVDVKADDEFPVESLRGETFTLKVDLLSAKLRSLPELNDEFAKESGEAETMLDLRARVREGIEHHKEHQAHHIAENNLLEQLLDANEIALPERFLEQQINNGIRQQLENFQRQGLSLGDTNFDFEGMREGIRKEKESQIRVEFLLSAIAVKEKLNCEEDDLKKYMAHQAMHMNVPPQQYAQYIQADPNRARQAVASALLEKTVNHLLEEASFKDIAWPDPEEEAKKAAAEAEKAAKKKKKAAPKKETKKAAPKKEAPKKAAPKKDAAPAKAKKAAPKKAAPKKAAPKKAAPKKETKKAAPKKETKKEAKPKKAKASVSFEALKSDELKALCKANDLKVSGKKADLIERLTEAGVKP